ncbi:hypothetical protein [Salinicola halimionae]|uniref:hypothetical protein n=1 Tax=Salinicola halimionae TaxID=1949081 RepID=UPI000DA23E4F|nr:hypothetical protein [Salinicola halimionae]
MRVFIPFVGALVLLSLIGGCTFNRYNDGQREVKPGVPQDGPTRNPADASRNDDSSTMRP